MLKSRKTKINVLCISGRDEMLEIWDILPSPSGREWIRIKKFFHDFIELQKHLL